jgi:hypothetical protein
MLRSLLFVPSVPSLFLDWCVLNSEVVATHRGTAHSSSGATVTEVRGTGPL